MDCKIILRWTYRDHLNRLIDYSEDFNAIHNFICYLRWETDKANQLGHGFRPLTQESRHSNVKLSISIDGKETHFQNVKQLGDFLRDNPEIHAVLKHPLPDKKKRY